MEASYDSLPLFWENNETLFPNQLIQNDQEFEQFHFPLLPNLIPDNSQKSDDYRKLQEAKCPTCGQHFFLWKDMYKHLRQVHRWPESEVRNTIAIRSIHRQTLPKRTSLIPKRGKTFGEFGYVRTKYFPYECSSSAYSKPKVPCPVPTCGAILGVHEALAVHCQQEHLSVGAGGQIQDYSLKEIYHDSSKDFEKWLCRLEHETRASFVKRTVSRDREVMYRCNRSGYHRAKDVSDSLRKGHPSRKVQLHCSAFVRLRYSPEGKCYTIYCSGHILHELDIMKNWLNKADKAYLKNLLCLYDYETTLKKLRDERSPDERIYWTTKNDLRNLGFFPQRNPEHNYAKSN